jgi:hypothetical protein
MEYIYEQVKGVTMGFRLSSVIANFFMEIFVVIALDTATLTPKVWLRYVDVFAVWRHGRKELDAFMEHLNS